MMGLWSSGSSLKQHTHNDPESARYGGEAKRRVQQGVSVADLPAHHSCGNAYQSDEGNELEYEFCDFEDGHAVTSAGNLSGGDLSFEFCDKCAESSITGHALLNQVPAFSLRCVYVCHSRARGSMPSPEGRAQGIPNLLVAPASAGGPPRSRTQAKACATKKPGFSARQPRTRMTARNQRDQARHYNMRESIVLIWSGLARDCAPRPGPR